MRVVHRLVIVAAFFLMVPIFIGIHANYKPEPPTIAEFAQAYAMALAIVAAIIYPISWVIAGCR